VRFDVIFLIYVSIQFFGLKLKEKCLGLSWIPVPDSDIQEHLVRLKGDRGRNASGFGTGPAEVFISGTYNVFFMLPRYSEVG
jgi:hypothetical protein